MVDAKIQRQLLDELDRMPVNKQRAVLDFAQGLARGRPRGASGADMMKFFGRLPPDDAQRMAEVIEEGCERIFPNEWQLPP